MEEDRNQISQVNGYFEVVEVQTVALSKRETDEKSFSTVISATLTTSQDN